MDDCKKWQLFCVLLVVQRETQKKSLKARPSRWRVKAKITRWNSAPVLLNTTITSQSNLAKNLTKLVFNVFKAITLEKDTL